MWAHAYHNNSGALALLLAEDISNYEAILQKYFIYLGSRA
jgi:hypothetical protein